jgi:hypothetical protein
LTFWGQNSILLIDYFQKPNYQRVVLLISAGAVERNVERNRCGNITNVVMILHEYAPAHRALSTQKKLSYLGLQCIDHPPYSPDLAPSDNHLFPGLKKHLKCLHFSSDLQVIASAQTWLDGQNYNFFEWIAKDRGTG